MDEMEDLNGETVLKNENPAFVQNMFSDVSYFLMSYGWYLFIAFIGIVYLYIRVHPRIEKFLKEKAEKEYDAKYHKNPDLALARQEQMERARKIMQEKMDKAAELHKIKMEERQFKKQQELLDKYNDSTDSGNRLGDKSSLRSEYNPLTGASGSSYRAPKRSACGGGGCGK